MTLQEAFALKTGDVCEVTGQAWNTLDWMWLEVGERLVFQRWESNGAGDHWNGIMPVFTRQDDEEDIWCDPTALRLVTDGD